MINEALGYGIMIYSIENVFSIVTYNRIIIDVTLNKDKMKVEFSLTLNSYFNIPDSKNLS